MAHGKFLMVTSTGEPFAVLVEFDGGGEALLDIWYYEKEEYQPPWKDLTPYKGFGQQPSNPVREGS